MNAIRTPFEVERRDQPRRSAAAVVLASLALVASGCDAPSSAPARATADDRPSVFVSLLPQKCFVERVAGGRVAVHVLVGPGQSEHVFEPTTQQMTYLAQSKLYFAIGSRAERNQLDRIEKACPGLRVIDTRDGVALRQFKHDETCAHEHADEREHAADESPAEEHDDETAGEPDPHVWMDPRLVRTQAQNIARALAELLPAHADEFARNLKRFEDELAALDARIEALLAPARGKPLFVYHPSFGYFADRYGLRQLVVEIGGREPSSKEAGAIIERARREGVRVLIAQPQFPDAPAKMIAREIGGAVITVDPLAEDYLANLESLAQQIAKAIKDAPGE